MTKMEEKEAKEINPLVTDRKILKELKKMVKELTTLKGILQTRKVTKNQCCNNLLEYLFSLSGKPTYVKLVVVTNNNRKKTTFQRKRNTLVVSVC